MASQQLVCEAPSKAEGGENRGKKKDQKKSLDLPHDHLPLRVYPLAEMEGKTGADTKASHLQVLHG